MTPKEPVVGFNCWATPPGPGGSSMGFKCCKEVAAGRWLQLCWSTPPRPSGAGASFDHCPSGAGVSSMDFKCCKEVGAGRWLQLC